MNRADRQGEAIDRETVAESTARMRGEITAAMGTGVYRVPGSAQTTPLPRRMCVPEGIAKGDPERSLRLTELVDIFDRFAK